MFSKSICCFVLLYNYVNIVNSITKSTDSLSGTEAKYHSVQNEKLHEIFTSLKSEATRTTMKVVRQAAAAIVNDDFDLPTEADKHTNSSEIGVLIENEGSGTDDFSEGEDATTKYEPVRINTTVSTQSTTNATESSTTSDEIKKIITPAEEDGSGDDIPLFTTELTTESRVTPDDTIQEIIPDICLNTTCNDNDLSVSASEKRNSVAEGMNFTLSCKGNSSNQMLYWYKSNGSVYFLQTFGTVEELHLNVPDTKTVHSGKYMCVRWVGKQTCCNLESSLTVYKLPPYRVHLTIIGILAAICLIVCIILSVRQVRSFKIYTKQFVEKHGKVKKQQQLL